MPTSRNRYVSRLAAAALSGLLALSPLAPLAYAQPKEADAITAQAEIPRRYDLRAQGVVTPVKFQNPFGTCWAFGGIAAAETSILSDAGETFQTMPLDLSEKHLAWFALRPVTESEDKAQAGEGLHVVVEEGQTETDAIYNYGGVPIYVTTLFASGTGPMLEKIFPYRGNAGLLESDYYKQNYDALLQDLIEDYAEEYADLDAAEVEALAKEELDYKVSRYETFDTYAKEDDWTIPEKDDKGNNSRDLFSGYTLRDGNVLPEIAKRGEETEEAPYGEWLGLSEDGMRAMKQEMLDGRAITIDYAADVSMPGEDETGIYLNLDNWAQYTFEDAEPTHAVAVVGWDDDYPAANFAHKVQATDDDGDLVFDANGNAVIDEARSAMTTPPGNGAWIVKNSWGSETDAVKDGLVAADGTKHDANKMNWGFKNADGLSTGYFYLSYYDKSVVQPETMVFDTDLSQDAFYAMQYDYMPATAGFWELSSRDNLASANVFASEATGDLVSVSTRCFEDNTRVTFKIYRLGEKAANPEDGELLTSFSRNFEYAGFHRVNLPQSVRLKKGERFSIVTCASTVDADGERIFGVEAAGGFSKEAMESFDEIDEMNLYSVAVVNPGESYLEIGPNWVDWADYQKTDEFARSAVCDLGGDSCPMCVDNFATKAYLVPAKS